MTERRKCKECLSNVLLLPNYACCAKVGSAEVFHYYCASIKEENFLKFQEKRNQFCYKCSTDQGLESSTDSSESEASEPEDTPNMVGLQGGGFWGNLRKLFLNGDCSDCEIVVMANSAPLARFPCHRIIIGNSSNFFSEANALKIASPAIYVENTDPLIIVAVLEFMYFNSVALEDWRFACNVLKMSKIWDVKKLTDICEHFLCRKMNTRNVCLILQVAIACRSATLMAACSELCHKTGFVILKAPAFRETTEEAIKYILQIPDFSTANEFVFEAVWNWSVYKCCRMGISANEDLVADEMLPFLHLLGFEFMSDEELKCVPDCVLDKFRNHHPGAKLGGREKDKPEDDVLRSKVKHADSNWRKVTFLSPTHCDYRIIVKNGGFMSMFPCQKLALYVASGVLAEMIDSTRLQIILVENTSPKTMFIFLKYILQHVVELNDVKSTCDVYTTAKIFQVDGLVLHCLKFLKENMSCCDVCYVLTYAILNKSEELERMCIKFIWWGDLPRIISSREFRNMNQETLKKVMELSCFKSRIKTLEFDLLWKMASVRCCKKNQPATRENVWMEMNQFLDYIDLRNLTEEEIDCIPEPILKILTEKTSTPQKGSRSVSTSDRKRGFPPSLPRHAKTFKTLSRRFPTVCVKKNIILFKFSINMKCCLPQFSISHLGPPMFNYLRSLRVYSSANRETIAKYQCQEQDDLQMTAIECSEEREITFKALRPLIVEPSVHYAVEVNYEREVSNLIWPLVSLANNADGDVELTLLTEHCYGLNYINFIPLSSF